MMAIGTLLWRPKRPNYTLLARQPPRDLFAKRPLVAGEEKSTAWAALSFRRLHSRHSCSLLLHKCIVVDNDIPTTLHRDEPQRNRKQSAHTHSHNIFICDIHITRGRLACCSNVDTPIIRFRCQSLGVRGVGQVTVISRLIISRLQCHVVVATWQLTWPSRDTKQKVY